MIEIDGSYLEGGGQILRTASALSAITRKPCWVFNIRKGRPKPGLMPQHRLGLQALAQLCNGRLEGDRLGSEEIKFYPGEITSKDLHIKIETAGSITLCLQSLLPAALFAPSPLKISFDGGATDTFFSPTIDYFRYIFLKILEKIYGVEPRPIEVKIIKRGYYPEGRAKIEVKIFPITKNKETCYQGDRQINKYGLKPLNLTERGEFKKISIFSVASEFLQEKKVAERQARAAEEVFKKLKLPIETKIEYTKTDCPGSSICLLSQYSKTILGADNLGRLGKSAEQVGKECALQLLEEEKSQACLDRFLADQILIYLALASEKSQVRVSQITNHTKTNLWVIEKFLDGKFEVKDNLIIWFPF